MSLPRTPVELGGNPATVTTNVEAAAASILAEKTYIKTRGIPSPGNTIASLAASLASVKELLESLAG